MEQTSWFTNPPEMGMTVAVAPTRREEARVRRPVRNQIQFLMQDLDATLPEDHQARVI